MIQEVFAKGTIKPLHIGMHLGGLGITILVDLVEFSQFLSKVLHGLTAVVNEHIIIPTSDMGQ